MLTPAEAGAGVCLDGSPPALYYVAAKSAAYNASWVVMLQGGGWCRHRRRRAPSAAARRSEARRSSRQTRRSLRVGGILHGGALRNPDFHAFRRVRLRRRVLRRRWRSPATATWARSSSAAAPCSTRSSAAWKRWASRTPSASSSAAFRPAASPPRSTPTRCGACARRAAGRPPPRASSGRARAPMRRRAVRAAHPFCSRSTTSTAAADPLHPLLMQQPAEGMWHASTRARRSRRARADIRRALGARHVAARATCGAISRACAASCFSAVRPPTRCAAQSHPRHALSTACGSRADVPRARGDGAFVTSCPRRSGAQSSAGSRSGSIGGVPFATALRRVGDVRPTRPPKPTAENYAEVAAAWRAGATRAHNCEPSCAKQCRRAADVWVRVAA